MTEEIKDRIEQIKAGRVPEGYIKTKAGITPTDWNMNKRAKEIFKSHSDKKHGNDLEILAATQENGIVPRSQIDIDIKCSDEGISGYKKVAVGDFVISLRSFQGGIEYSPYDGIVSPAYTVLKPTVPISDEYYKNYFKTAEFISRLNGAIYGIRDGKQIGYEDFGDIVVHYPPLPEQKKIAEILRQCNKVIELKQSKIEELQELKKACLNKMFPKEGHNVPELRFPGFTDAWEQRKVSDEVDSVDTGKSKFSLKEDGQYEILGSTSVIGFDDEYDYEGDFLLTARVGANAGTMYRHSGKVKITDNTVFLQGKNLDFLFYMLIHFDLHQLSFGTGQPLVKASELKSLYLLMPKKLEEKERISAYFRNLDNLITLHQRELEETRKYKKALMQLLLTGIVRVQR